MRKFWVSMTSGLFVCMTVLACEDRAERLREIKAGNLGVSSAPLEEDCAEGENSETCPGRFPSSESETEERPSN